MTSQGTFISDVIDTMTYCGDHGGEGPCGPPRKVERHDRTTAGVARARLPGHRPGAGWGRTGRGRYQVGLGLSSPTTEWTRVGPRVPVGVPPGGRLQQARRR